MNIKFNSLYLRNFFSFDEAKLDLNYSGYVLVSGVNNCIDDMAKSNGSGKSSIWEAIIWCLTGETIRGTKQIANKHSTNGVKVELDFTIDTNCYRITRYKEDVDFGTNLKFYVNNEDKSGKGIRDTEKILEDYLPDLNSQLLGSVIILGQGLPQRFTNNTPSGRKEILEKLSKSDFMIQDIKDKLADRKGQLNVNLRSCEDSILCLKSESDLLTKQLDKLKQDKKVLDDINTSNFDNELAVYESKLDIYEKEKEQHDTTIAELNINLDNKLSEYNAWTSKVNNNLLHEYSIIEEKYDLLNVNKEIDSLRNLVTLKESRIKELESVTDICPTCGQKLPDVHKVDTHKDREELQNLKESLAVKENNLSDLNEKAKHDKQKVLDTLNSDTQKLKCEYDNIKKLLESETLQLDVCLTEIKNINLLVEKIRFNKETYEKQKESIDKSIADTEKSLSELSEKNLYYITEKDNILKHIDIVNKMTTIATRDFRGFLLSEAISYINNKAKEYSSIIFDNDKVNFELNGNNIDITYLDKEYESLSGGEKQKIDIIVQFAIRDMLSQFLNFSSNILVLDEIFDNLDSVGCQKLLDMISNKLNDIEGIYIITHHNDIDIPCDKELVIVKDEKGVSRLQ